MSLYIGALGLETFDDAIEDASNTLVNRIVSDINYTSNYVLATSNILATRINDTSNILATRINDTSNVLATRIKALEGTEGTPGDISLGIPAIPSTGGFATAAAIAALTAASYLGGVSVLTMVTSLEIKVDSNKAQADLIGGWSSNYSDKVGVWGSNYVLTTSNILIGRINDTSNYVWNTSNILIGRINDTSNYVWNTSNILIGRINDTSNYVWNTSNILVGRINDTSNYVWNTSNILIGRINDTSNYVWNTSNILIGRINDTSNYVLETSNILIGRINDTSNYVWNTSNILVGRIKDTSNYIETTSNILIGRINDTSNYVGNTSNILIGRINDTSNYIETTSNILVGRIDDTSNYVWNISNILVGRINDTSNYVWNTSNILLGRINDTSNYVWNTSNILIGRINDTSNYVERINTELTTADTTLGVRVDNTSNYVKRINTELNTSDIELGVRVDNTSNYVLTTSNILVGMLNGRITQFYTTIPKGNYTIKVRDYLDDYIANGVYYISTFTYYYSDRYNGDTSRLNFYNNIPTSVVGKSTLYYNAGDQIEFKMSINGSTDTYTYPPDPDGTPGVVKYNSFMILRSPPGIAWGNAGSIFAVDNYPFTLLYIFRNLNILKYIAYGLPQEIIGLYNDTFVLPLEAGYDYWLTRYVLVDDIARAINPIRIKVNNPIFDDATSYIPPVIVKPSTAVPGRKSIPLYKGVNVNSTGDAVETTTTTLDYELSTGFKYDDTSNIVSVFDGNYNNLTNKPSLITSTDITYTSNYVSRINSDLTTAIGGKAPTSHTHTIANITNLQTTLDGKAPTSHSHTIANITDLQTTLDGKAPTSHTHTIANITNLQTTLDGKAPTSHSHIISDITNLQTTLDGKAPTSHTHTIANITNLQTTLDGKAPTSHTHIIGDVTGLQTALSGLQAKIISTAGQLIIGNGDGITTTSTGLTWTTTTNLLTTTNLAVSTQATITQLLTTGQTADMFILQNNATNSLRFQQVFNVVNDNKWILNQKSNNIDYPIFNFRNGKICVGTSANPAYMLDVVGDINITGEFRKNASIYKPANAVLADSATTAIALATSRNIAGVAFNGTADVVVDYVAINNKPLTLTPTTTNFVLTSGYNLLVPGNVGVGTSLTVANILQVGAGGRLRISNGTTDYTTIGTLDVDGATNTSIVISGTTRSTNAGNIQYLATASGGSHIFYTASTTTRMTISSSGVNINNDLGVSGNVGIGVAPSATYKVNVSGTLNATSVLVNGTAISGSQWTTSGTSIYYNAGNVGIGATTTSDVDDNTAFAIPTATLYVKGGASAGGTCDVVIRGGVAGGEQGKAKLWLMSDASHSSYIQSQHTGSGNTNLTFGVASGNALPTERIKINANGNVAIQSSGGGIGSGSMSAGSLCIGNTNQNYGGGQNWNANTAGLLMECLDGTEIAVHDGGNAVHSFMYYSGNNFRIGRNMTWGVPTLYITGGLRCDSYLYVAGTIQASGAYYFPADTWCYDNNSKYRFYFGGGGLNTLYLSGGSTGYAFSASHEFRRENDQFTLAYLTNIGYMYAYAHPTISDRRIKKDIEEINDEEGLNKLLLVQPTKYNYIDEVRNQGRTGKVFGFIAQQIREVIPEAITIQTGIILNINKTCLVYNKREIYHSIPLNVPIDTEVSITISDRGKRYKIKEIYDDHFVIDEDIDADEAFVSGYSIDDLHYINKDYIFTLNVCATQELHRRIEAQNVIIISQEQRIKELEGKMTDILKYLSL